MYSMKSNADVSICLHHFLGDFWYMDGKCFLLFKKYLEKYYTADNEFSNNIIESIICVTVKKHDLIEHREFFQVKEFGKRALLLSFIETETDSFDSDKLINFELIYKENEKIKTRKVLFKLIAVAEPCC